MKFTIKTFFISAIAALPLSSLGYTNIHSLMAHISQATNLSATEITTNNLFAAIRDRDVAAAIQAVNAGANISAQTGSMESAPLHSATSTGSLEVMSFLLDRGAPIEMRNNSGWTPLHLAAMFGTKQVINLLIDNGAAIDAQDNGGLTPLNLARLNHRADNVAVLQEALRAKALKPLKEYSGDWVRLRNAENL